MKIGLLSYKHHTNNLGDYVQSIATEHLLGHYDTLVSREELNNYTGEPIKLIMNGWFMENPQNWPPSEAIKPLFISFHINPTVASKMLNNEGINYLHQHAPIGCRDYYTLAQLQAHGIPSYFSGCNTLTLNRKNFTSTTTSGKNILVVGVLDRIITEKQWHYHSFQKKFVHNAIAISKFPAQYARYRMAKKKLDGILRDAPFPVQALDQIHDMRRMTEKERLEKAKNFLSQLAKARLVITSRIHTAMPAVAFGVPVIFIEDGLEHINQYSRIIGLNRFFNAYNVDELLHLDLNEVQNPNQHQKYARFIYRKVKNFIVQK